MFAVQIKQTELRRELDERRCIRVNEMESLCLPDELVAEIRALPEQSFVLLDLRGREKENVCILCGPDAVHVREAPRESITLRPTVVTHQKPREKFTLW